MCLGWWVRVEGEPRDGRSASPKTKMVMHDADSVPQPLPQRVNPLYSAGSAAALKGAGARPNSRGFMDDPLKDPMTFVAVQAAREKQQAEFARAAGTLGSELAVPEGRRSRRSSMVSHESDQWTEMEYINEADREIRGQPVQTQQQHQQRIARLENAHNKRFRILMFLFVLCAFINVLLIGYVSMTLFGGYVGSSQSGLNLQQSLFINNGRVGVGNAAPQGDLEVPSDPLR